MQNKYLVGNLFRAIFIHAGIGKKWKYGKEILGTEPILRHLLYLRRYRDDIPWEDTC